ncbi:FAD/FMN-containing isoamyl alcohol oxidase-like protein MreA [Wilcoxina mikolae CBS 423.85]|nr:FAD/FMN-containing isoamyl alcohol oxidase-like protein MreA [Wilcoxina mikolae CBS 423.85]
MWAKSFLSVSLIVGAASALPQQFSSFSSSSCKAYPDTPSWPSSQQWLALNNTVNGRLDAVIPPGAICHNSFNGISTYNAAACSAYQANIALQQMHINIPADIQWDFWTNRTCIPLTADPNTPCTIGTYPRYVVKAETVEDVQAGVNFARMNNVRLVIKNTGHDFMGKSTGAGSLSIWTHLFKEIEIIDKYDDPSTDYYGSAVKFGAGWQVRDAYNTLAAVGKVIVAGECATVGFSGGYVQGGGHGPLAPIYGMAADSVLQFTLVTAEGEYITANAKNNSDIFWAIRGGGGAAFGVVISVTVKTYDTPSVSGAVITYNYTETTNDTFWAGIDAFHSFAPSFGDASIYGYYELSDTKFFIKPLLAPGKTLQELTAIVAPFLAKLDALGVPYTSSITEHPTFKAGYDALFDGEGAGTNMLTSSRMILRDHVAANHTAVTKAFRRAAEEGYYFIGHLIAPGVNGGVKPETSVNPIWKDGLLLPLYNHFWNGSETEDQKWAVIDHTLNVIDAGFKEVSPGSGTYLNEANIYEPNWANDFYGASYPRLLSIKKQVDPQGVFYAKTAVGSEFWTEVNGRLCKT